MTSSADPRTAPAATPDAATLLRSRPYIALVVFGAIVGFPVAAIAYGFLKAVAWLQHYFYITLPGDVGFDTVPAWWPLPLLAIGGLLVGLTIRHLHGTAGHSPADGFKSEGPTNPVDLPGIVLAALATLAFGGVLGPEAPLIAIGSGIGVLAVHLARKDAPAQASIVIGTAGSFAAVSTLFGSPLPAAFLLMEVAGIGGPILGVILVPGLLAAGIGALAFVGLDNWTGWGTFSLAVPNLQPFGTPTVKEALWAIVIGVLGAMLGTAIRRLALRMRPLIERRIVVLAPVAGLGVGAMAVIFTQGTDHGSDQVLFSGQDALAPLLENPAAWTVGALVLLVICKSVAYSLSLSSFRGGPTFPGMFIGAAGGIALSHLPGLPPEAGAAMGIGAMTVAMLGLPLTAVLLVAVFLQAEGLALMPLVIISVVVSYLVSAQLDPTTDSQPAPAEPAPAPSPA